MSELDWLKGEWRKLDPDFRRQAAANAFGTVVGGLALAVFLGLAAISARYLDTWVFIAALVVSTLAWILALGSVSDRSAIQTLSGVVAFVAAPTFTVALLALIGRLALAGNA